MILAVVMQALDTTIANVALPYIQGSVIDGCPLAALRPLVTDAGHARTAEALALERVREGLHRLCDLWRMRPNERPLPLAAWRAGPEDAAVGDG